MKLRLSRAAAQAWKGLTATFAALLLTAVLGWLISIAVDIWIIGDPLAHTGWSGIGRMMLGTTLQVLVLTLPALVCFGLLLNALSARRLDLGEILSRAGRAIPTSLVLSAIALVVNTLGAAPAYFLTNGGWTPWLAFKASSVVSAGISVFIGYAEYEAISRRVGVLPAMAGSLAVTRGHRWTLFAIWLVCDQLTDEVSLWTGGSVDAWLTVNEMTDLGSRPVMTAVWMLFGLVLTPLTAAIYVQLRRLQNEAGPDGVAAAFE